MNSNDSKYLKLLCLILLMGIGACSHRQAQQASVPRTPAPDGSNSDRSYMDLEPGWKLRIVVPLIRAGSSNPQPSMVEHANGNTITLSANNILGYEISNYSVLGKANGIVKLKFTSASKTIDTTTVAEPKPPPLPFRLPRSTGHIRLIYLIARSSVADHKMAIVASKQLASLDAFTTRLQANPRVCDAGPASPVFCAWVPPGVAVRPEKEL